MAGKKGHIGPPGNANAFRHGLAALQNRRANGALTAEEEDIRADILAGLIAAKGGEQQIGTAELILAEIISSDVALLVTFNQAIDGVIRKQPKGSRESQGLGPARRLLLGCSHRLGWIVIRGNRESLGQLIRGRRRDSNWSSAVA